MCVAMPPVLSFAHDEFVERRNAPRFSSRIQGGCCTVIDLLRSLFRHQEWADEALLKAVQSHPESLHDQDLYKVLHHIVMVQRVFLCFFQERPFDRTKESQLPESFDQLVQLFRDTHIEELTYVDGLTESELERRFDLAFLGARPTVAEGLTQVVMHSQNHRGQCLTKIRENGGKPPTLDYIKWAKNQGTDRSHSMPPHPVA
jgi:uncharacterized damage-inducible protein DinB